MYMKTKIVIIFMFFSFTVFSQDISVLKIAVFENGSNKPVIYKDAILYDGLKVLGDSFLNDNGICTFTFDSLFSNSDSVYFFIKTEDSLSYNIKVFINDLSLIDSNVFGNYSIKITYFNIFTQDEYIERCKKFGLMPRRKKLWQKMLFTKVLLINL
ncbi:MAG: hypothetical protein CVU06_15155 [Bacteroidetes bacterium HGW-Bacteroidetes-22]|nr:MAG: hypothetical protein CVU06_15155 [Bacteroidetes bacterium HGW-Bacteroidetes-22]